MKNFWFYKPQEVIRNQNFTLKSQISSPNHICDPYYHLLNETYFYIEENYFYQKIKLEDFVQSGRILHLFINFGPFPPPIDFQVFNWRISIFLHLFLMEDFIFPPSFLIGGFHFSSIFFYRRISFFPPSFYWRNPPTIY